MPVEQKAERFVDRLARKLNSAECATMGEAKFRAMFQTAVEDLPDNKKLKHFLSDNFDTYFNKLWSTVQGITVVQETVPGSGEHRYNLRAAEGLQSALQWVGTLPQAEQMPHYLSLFQRCFPAAQGSDALLDSIISSKKDDLDCLVTLTQLLDLNKQAVALQKVASAFVRRLEQAYDNCLQGDTQGRAAELREIVIRFLTVLNIQRDPTVKWEDPDYEDLVAAFVSLYVDLSLLVTRTQLSTSSAGNVSEVSQSIGNCILVWLGHSPTHILDVLLQSEPDRERDGAILTPVYRRFLHTAPSPLTHGSYIRYVCAVCKAREIIPEYSPTWKTLQKAALSTPAPPGFLPWLRSRSADLMDQVPNTPKWRGSHVTQFLVLESTQDFRENLLDLITEGLEQPVSVEQPGVQGQKEETKPSTDADLFFVDTRKDEDTAVQMESDDAELEHSREETALLGEIHNLLGKFDVCQDMSEEKERSEESDVEEIDFQVPKSKAKRKEEVAEVVARSLQTYRKGYVKNRAQEERDSTSGPWAVKYSISPLHGRAVRAAEMDSRDSTDAVCDDAEDSKVMDSEESGAMTAAVEETVSVPLQKELTSDGEGEDDEETAKYGKDIPASVEKEQKKATRKGKKKSKKESMEGGSKQQNKVGISFEGLKLQEGESYDSSQESVEMIAFKASASELLQDVEKFMNTTKQGQEELQEDMDQEDSTKDAESAENYEISEANSIQAEITVSEEKQMNKADESEESDSSEPTDTTEEGLQAQHVGEENGSIMVQEQGQEEPADLQGEAESIPDSQSDSDSGDDGPKILKLRTPLSAPTSKAEPDLNQSEIIPVVDGTDKSKIEEVVVQAQDEDIVEEVPRASAVAEQLKENIFKTPVSPVRGKSSPARVKLSPCKTSPVKTKQAAVSPGTRRRRLSTDEEIHELAAEVTEKIARDLDEGDGKVPPPATPPKDLSSEVRRRSMLGQSYGKFIEQQTFPDIMEGTENSEVPVVADETTSTVADVTTSPKSQDLEPALEQETEAKTAKSSSESEVSVEEIESSKATLPPEKSAKEREPTPMVKRERRKTAQKTLQPVGEEPSDGGPPDSTKDSSDSSLSSNSRRKSLRRRKADTKEKEEESVLAMEGEPSTIEAVHTSEKATVDGQQADIRQAKGEENGTEVVSASKKKAGKEDETDIVMERSTGDLSSEQQLESAGKKQGKVLRMVQSPTPKKNKGGEHSIQLVSPKGSPEWQFATGGHIVVKVSSDSPDHKPTIVQSPTGELTIKAYNPKVVVAPDFAGNAKRLDFDGTGTVGKDGTSEGTGTKRDASSASLDLPKAKMVLRTRSRSPIPSDSSSLTSVSSMSDAASGSRRKSQRSMKKAQMESLLQQEHSIEELTQPDLAVPSTSGTRPQRSKARKFLKVIAEDIGSQQVSDSDLSVSSQSSSSRRRSRAAVATEDVSDNQGQGRGTRKRATAEGKQSPPKKVKTAGDDGGDAEEGKKETEEAPEVIVLESSPSKETQESQLEPVGETRPITRGRVKRESESTVSEVWSDVDMFSLSPPHTRRSSRLKAVHETLSNASSVSDQSALDSEQEGSISSRTRSSHKRRSEQPGRSTRAAVKTETEARKRLSMLI